jgi:hypothetical protein
LLARHRVAGVTISGMPTLPPSFLNHLSTFKACRGNTKVCNDINVLAFVKGEERYLFLYKDETRSETLKTLGRFASNPELSFSWYDAAVLSQRVRAESKAKFPIASRINSDILGNILLDDEPLG